MPKTNKPRKTSRSQGTFLTRRRGQASTTTNKESFNSDSARAGNSVTIDVNTTDVTQSASNPNIDVSVLTEQITKTVTSAVLNNLRAAGLFEREHNQVSGIPNQLSNERQISPEVEGINNLSTFTSEASSSSAGLSGQTMSFAQSSFNAHVDAAKSGFISAAIPLHSRVPMKTKEGIWNNEFVELSTLYDEETDDVTISLKSGKISTSNSTKRKYMSIEQWTDAFNVYMSVYRLKFPDQSEQLSTYLNTVRKIALENGQWHYYDTNFRKIRQSIGLQWNQIHSELYVTAMMRKQKQPFRSNRDLPATSRSRSSFAIKNTCHKFNRGSECSGCVYKHMCRHCGGRHPGFKCWKEHSSRFNSFLPTQSNQQNPNLSDARQSKNPIPSNPSAGRPPK